jgi:alkylhydroperoxidase/carboxymuconolactone decarboxylase family protein YurZ
MESELTDREAEIKQQFEEDVGYWVDGYTDVLRLDPEFFDHFRKLVAQPYQNGALEPKVRELLLVAVNSSVTHLHADGVRIHIQNALDHGATFDEIVEILQRTTGVGIHAISIGIPILYEEANLADSRDEFSEEETRIREKYEEQRGYWNASREKLLHLDARFLDHYTDLSSHAFLHGPLDTKVKEFVAIANDASTTHLYESGLRTHIQNALDEGATPEEIMEVLELTSTIGIQAQVESAPILIEEAEIRDVLPDDW